MTIFLVIGKRAMFHKWTSSHRRLSVEWLRPIWSPEPWLATNSGEIGSHPILKFENGLLHFAIEKFVGDWQTSAQCVRVISAWAR